MANTNPMASHEPNTDLSYGLKSRMLWKVRLPITAYWIATFFLVGCTVFILYKLLTWPPCIPPPTDSKFCAIDGGSIAGLAATVLGVSATVLAILGAFALATWWTGLEKRVSDQVNDLYNQQAEKVKSQVNALLAAQTQTIATRMDDLLSDQTRKGNELLEQYQNLRLSDSYIGSDIVEVRSLAKTVLDVLLEYLQDKDLRPWEMEGWAASIADKFSVPSLVEVMISKYLDCVVLFFDANPSEQPNILQSLVDQGGPKSILDYWNAALDWKERLDLYYDEHEEPIPSKIIDPIINKVNKYRPKLEVWRQQSC